jgi:hypothetical protein
LQIRLTATTISNITPLFALSLAVCNLMQVI